MAFNTRTTYTQKPVQLAIWLCGAADRNNAMVQLSCKLAESE